jgi:hypothetical protein
MAGHYPGTSSPDSMSLLQWIRDFASFRTQLSKTAKARAASAVKIAAGKSKAGPAPTKHDRHGATGNRLAGKVRPSPLRYLKGVHG